MLSSSFTIHVLIQYNDKAIVCALANTLQQALTLTLALTLHDPEPYSTLTLTLTLMITLAIFRYHAVS